LLILSDFSVCNNTVKAKVDVKSDLVGICLHSLNQTEAKWAVPLLMISVKKKRWK